MTWSEFRYINLINRCIYVLHEPLLFAKRVSPVLIHTTLFFLSSCAPAVHDVESELGCREVRKQVTSVPSDARLQSLKHVNKPITWLVSVVIVLSMPVAGPLQVSPPERWRSNGGGAAHAAGSGAPTCVDKEVSSSNEFFSTTTSRYLHYNITDVSEYESPINISLNAVLRRTEDNPDMPLRRVISLY
jgi:hypothetical protein